MKQGEHTAQILEKENKTLRGKLKKFRKTADEEIKKFKDHLETNQNILKENKTKIGSQLDKYEDMKTESKDLNKEIAELKDEESLFAEDMEYLEKALLGFDEMVTGSLKELEIPLKKVDKVS